MLLIRTFVALAIASAHPAFAQWTADGAGLAGRFSQWRENGGDYSPELAIGASSLAFDDQGTLYLACEKHADVLTFPQDGSAPERIRLTGVKRKGGFPDVDIEAMSVHDGVLYLMNEDCDGCADENFAPESVQLFLYATPLDSPGPTTIIPIEYAMAAPVINPKSTNSDPSNLSSIEGLVVSATYHGRTADRERIGQGPYVYMLDELDVEDGGHRAKLYIGTLHDGRVTVSVPPISFSIPEGFRMPELFEYQGHLYCLRTNYITRNDYRVFLLIPDESGLQEACDFSDSTKTWKSEGYDSNFEGAAVNPLDGRLFLTADNENYQNASSSETPPQKPKGRGVTPIVVLKPAH